jgi:glycosyltransferase involved in cell wall biosynthesis
MERLLLDEDLRQTLVKKGHRQVRGYSWWECARQTHDIYLKALG